MRKKSIAKLLAAFAAACALSCAMTSVAFAVTTYPATTSVSPESVSGSTVQPDSSGEPQNRVSINVVDFLGNPGETVFISAKVGDQQIANFFAHELGDGAQGAKDADVSADAFAIDVNREALEDEVKAGIHVDVFDSRAGGADHTIGSYDVRGVYAAFINAEGEEVASSLIGTCTDGATFTAPENTSYKSLMYRLDGDATATASGKDLKFTYKQYDPQSTIDGVIRYLDVKSGQALKYTTPISGLAKDETREVKLPDSIKENGYVYRPISFETSVIAKNPGTTSFSIPVFALGVDDAGASYMADIKLKAGDETIASDAVFVSVPTTYTAPDTIYKKRNGMVYTYKLIDSPTYTFDPKAAEGERSKTFGYEQLPFESTEIDVTFNRIDGQKRVGARNRKLADPEIVKVDKDNITAMPTQETIEANGTTYKMVGEPGDYEYTYGSGEVPVIDVYYVPKDYEASEPYQVTVNYVNFYDRSVIDSETFESSPDSLGNVDFTAPENFSANGVDWVRLDGQGSSISHNYYSNRTGYTIYYRDSSQKLESAPTITQIVTAPATTTTTTTTAATTGTAATATGTGTTGTARTAETGGTNNATGTDAATTDASLRDGETYNVAEGEGVNQTATTQDGRDAVQERIEENDVALADGLGSSDDVVAKAPVDQEMPGWVIPLICIVIVALIAGVTALTVLRRKNGNRGV